MMISSLISHGIFPTLAEGNPIEHVLPHRVLEYPIFHLMGRPVYLTSQIVVMLVAALLMLLVFPYIGSVSKRELVPKGIRNLFEAILSYLRTEVFRPALGDNTDRFTPFLWTVFFFILFCNLLGMVPVDGIIKMINVWTGTNIPELGGTPTANINMTGAMAIVAFFMFHINGIIQQIKIQMDPSLDPHHTGPDHLPPHGHGGTIGSEGLENKDVRIDGHPGDGHDHAHGFHRAHGPTAIAQGKPFPVAIIVGFFHYWKNFVPPVPWVLWPIMFALELVGALIKPFALCLRLFANMVAGHLVLASFISLIFVASAYAVRGTLGIVIVGAGAAFSCLELFVAFLQAYIFTFLTTLFLAAAVSPEH